MCAREASALFGLQTEGEHNKETLIWACIPNVDQEGRKRTFQEKMDHASAELFKFLGIKMS